MSSRLQPRSLTPEVAEAPVVETPAAAAPEVEAAIAPEEDVSVAEPIAEVAETIEEPIRRRRWKLPQHRQ